jgi:hypothetical protein
MAAGRHRGDLGGADVGEWERHIGALLDGCCATDHTTAQAVSQRAFHGTSRGVSRQGSSAAG